MSDAVLAEPWRSFLQDLDTLLDKPTELHCLGGFVISELYDFERITADVDVIVVRGEDPAKLAALAGQGSELHRRHKVYLDLRLKALERHDLVLAKLSRNIDRDREDVKRLALGPGLDPEVLRERYQSELRWQLSRPEREDTTLDLWLEIIAEITVPQEGPKTAT